MFLFHLSAAIESFLNRVDGQEQKPELAEEPSFDFTTPVSSFLAKSRQRMSEYFGSEEPQHEEPPDTIRVFTTDVERKEVQTDQDDGENEAIDLSKLETLLNPNSARIRELIEKHVLKNPKLLTEMLSVDFEDLVRVFKHFARKESLSSEAAYLRLFELLESEAAEGVTELAASLPLGESEEDEDLPIVESKEEKVAALFDLHDKVDGKDEL